MLIAATIGALCIATAGQEFDTFNWGIAPAPQFDKSTTGASKIPVTFGDPTGLGINPALSDGAKLTVAKSFLAYAAGEQAAKALATIGITPAVTSDAVIQTFFGQTGVPRLRTLSE